MDKENKTPDKLTDKAFSRLLFTSVLGIVICLVCLCSATWAWFSDSIPSDNNNIQSASECLLDVSVYKDGTVLSGSIEDGVILEEGATYTVVLSLPKDSSSGYCIITAGGVSYKTDYIAHHTNELPETLSFTLTVAKEQKVFFKTHWGIYSDESDVKNGSLLLP